MKILTFKNSLYYAFSLSIITINLHAQEVKNNVKQSPKFEQLLNEKRKINTVLTVNERYKIQIFSGDSESAKKALYECKQEFNQLDGTIIFNTPNYKVWIGNFRTRIEAERNLVEVKKRYNNAFLIKPKK
ncbi:MAG: SPOR domain-containing protein [Flavobacteriaceae bacterium]|uniref:SPOR domain-containing protein n=1 Tax=Flavobacterium kayseriense TaxID=2764714 RepID=A0ABR7J4I5_9FLAO|nr:SPOR domain-containing protein [Flavobacterium kayseriense]MBC5840127.1 SPOR domain-containing protein [Flavobacterium kayseriense]MBC5847203.1 SPOR domain-containing protein [Flavobacterium kayseriense]MBU0941764.1 SPOR domain-containing protein [Bacteroidota bacterium]MBX9887849.1 SPOR domain-containing protein [Flavobacteriaceae bacterium]